MVLADHMFDGEMHRYIVALDRPRGSAGSRGDAIEANRQITDRFKADLRKVLNTEGFSRQVAQLDPTETLPILYMTGTHAVAERVRLMDGVRSVAPDAEFDLPVGQAVSDR